MLKCSQGGFFTDQGFLLEIDRLFLDAKLKFYGTVNVNYAKFVFWNNI